MDRSRLGPLLGQVFGLLLHFLGLFLFIIVVVQLFFPGPDRSVETVTDTHVAWMAVGIVLLVGGRLVTWRFGTSGDPLTAIQDAVGGEDSKHSRLRDLGYRLPADQDDEEDDYAYVDGSVYLVCRDCGTRNQREYSYCSNCSAELPE